MDSEESAPSRRIRLTPYIRWVYPSGMSQRLGGKGRGDSPKLLIRMPRRLIEDLKDAAKRDRRTVSDWVRLTLEDAIKKGDRR